MILVCEVRMAVIRNYSWSHPKTAANYLNDLWIFDTQEYNWKQVEFKDNDRKPSWVTSSGSD